MYKTYQLHVNSLFKLGHHQVGYNCQRNHIKQYIVIISVSVSEGGRDFVYKRLGRYVSRLVVVLRYTY